MPKLSRKNEEPLDQKGSDVVGRSLDHLFGCWSAQEEQEFLQAIEIFEQIEDPLDIAKLFSATDPHPRG